MRGFTLIELLIVVAIVSILASIVLLNFGSAKFRARNTAFKAMAASLQPDLVLCCYTPSTPLANIPGSPMCTNGANYPPSTDIGSITESDCSSTSTFSVTVTPGTNNSGNCTSATITATSITYAGVGC